MNHIFKLLLITTGGTIEKTYNELEGILHNDYRISDIMLELLDLRGIEISKLPLMNKDSLQMTEEDVQLIINTISDSHDSYDGIIVIHGTDTLQITAEALCKKIKESKESNISMNIPIIFTGAMKPYMLRNTDALQNLTESLMAIQLVDPGVYVVMHNKVLKFPGVVKNRENMTFVKYH